MAITNVITNTVKDVFAISQNLAKVIKEEVELKMNKTEDDDIFYENTVHQTVSNYFEGFETKAKELVNAAFSGFQSSKSEEQAELEARIAALEEKLSKLVEESLENIRNKQ